MRKINFEGQSGWFLSDDQKKQLDKVLKPLLSPEQGDGLK